MRSALEATWQRSIFDAENAVAWLVEYSAVLLNRREISKDGETSSKRQVRFHLRGAVRRKGAAQESSWPERRASLEQSVDRRHLPWIETGGKWRLHCRQQRSSGESQDLAKKARGNSMEHRRQIRCSCSAMEPWPRRSRGWRSHARRRGRRTTRQRGCTA